MISGFNTSLADKVVFYRNDAKRYKVVVMEQRNLLRDTEAFLESIFLDGKWEKRLICSGNYQGVYITMNAMNSRYFSSAWANYRRHP